MLDRDGQPDAGLITEVLWLGHAMNLIYDASKRSRLVLLLEASKAHWGYRWMRVFVGEARLVQADLRR